MTEKKEVTRQKTLQLEKQLLEMTKDFKMQKN